MFESKCIKEEVPIKNKSSKENDECPTLPESPKFLKEIKRKYVQESNTLKEKIELINLAPIVDRQSYRTDAYIFGDKKLVVTNELLRFPPAHDSLPKDWRFYGLNLSEIEFTWKEFLDFKECAGTELFRIDNKYRDDLLFLTTNINRGFVGGFQYTREKKIPPIKAGMSFEIFPPRGKVFSYNYENFHISFLNDLYEEKFLYGSINIDENITSPWFLNICTKGMSLALNECWLDQRYDISIVDFFYLTAEDKLLANYYCKKSAESAWVRVGKIEFYRTL